MNTSPNFRYVTLADQIQENIAGGMFRPGDRLPSLRKLHTRLGLSITTVHQAYIELEKRGQVEAREKSGFYVRPLSHAPRALPEPVKTRSGPSLVNINSLAQTIISELEREDILQLGAAVYSKELMPLKQLTRIMKSIPAAALGGFFSSYETCAGNQSLRRAIAGRMAGQAGGISHEDIITTNGCLEAVSLCLRAVAGPGDAILVESPVFHCFLQLIEDLNMRVVEIPACPQQGILPQDFKTAVDSGNVAACLLNSNFQNPLGYRMSRHNKAAILKMALKQDIPIIEDDIYGDLYFSGSRPSTYKSMDPKGMVLYCSSVSKTLAPGLRTGWVIPGRFRERVIRSKTATTVSNAGINQEVTARFINTGAYDRHLRTLRNHLKNQASALSMALHNHFPKDIRMTFPKGGMFLWVVLHPDINTMDIFHKAHENNISILPGLICSSSDRYKNCLRLNCGIKWGPKMEQGIACLGKLVKQAYKG